MALKQPFAVKNVLGETDLTLEAGPGESFLVKDILTHYCSDDYCTVMIDKTTVGYFRQSGTLGAHIFRLASWNRHSHGITLNIDQPASATADYRVRNARGENLNLLMPRIANGEETGNYRWNEAVQRVTGGREETLLQYLDRIGLWKGFPVAEGETLTIEGVSRANAKQVLVYEIYEGEDQKSDTENGSKSKVYTFLNYGNCGESINTNGDSLYTTSVSPVEFPAFPFGQVVPAKHQIEILGIAASPFAPKENDDTNYIYTRYLKLVKDREVLFDEDRNGIIFENRQLDLTGRVDSVAEGFSLIGNKSEYDTNDPLMFNPPLKFIPGDELSIYVTTVKGSSGQDISISQHEICLIERVTRLE